MTAERRMALAEDALARSTADGTEITVTAAHQALTRFTHENVNQNLNAADVTLRVRAIVDGRSGIATANAFDLASLTDVVARARELAAFAPRPDPAPVLAGPARAEAPAGAYVPATAAATPATRANVAGAVFARARAAGLWSSGYVSTSFDGVTIATSAGARLSYDGTTAAINVKMNGSDATGFAEHYAPDVGAIDGTAVAERAARKAFDARAPQVVEPGDWTVILEPAAAGELLRYLSFHFSAQAFAEGSSFLTGRLGSIVLGANVTLRDDVTHPLNPRMPFDFEGTPTQRVTLIDNGVAANVVTDSTWSRRLNRANTGHALAAPSSEGPQTNATVLEPGEKPVEQLVAETKRGLLITRLWYVRVVDQRTARLTGMTRDGTFLIENGRVTSGVRNMRFNASIADALQTCEIAAAQERTGGYSYSLVTPAVKLARFHFASASPY